MSSFLQKATSRKPSPVTAFFHLWIFRTGQSNEASYLNLSCFPFSWGKHTVFPHLRWNRTFLVKSTTRGRTRCYSGPASSCSQFGVRGGRSSPLTAARWVGGWAWERRARGWRRLLSGWAPRVHPAPLLKTVSLQGLPSVGTQALVLPVAERPTRPCSRPLSLCPSPAATLSLPPDLRAFYSLGLQCCSQHPRSPLSSFRSDASTWHLLRDVLPAWSSPSSFSRLSPSPLCPSTDRYVNMFSPLRM